jgi:hypothetical protein
MSSSSSNSTVSADSPSKIPPSPPPPVSPSSRRTQANRENAQHSTGPRTKEGKSRSALNATIHGGFADKLILPNENQELFAHFYTDTLKALQPANALELSLAQRIISLDWRLRRIQAADTGLHFTRLERFQHNADRFAQSEKGQRLQTQDPDLAPRLKAENLPEGFTLAYAYDPPAGDPATVTAAGENPFERLAKTEHRLANMLHRALKDLQSLQKTRKENPPPIHDDDDDPIDPDPIDDEDEEHDGGEPTDGEDHDDNADDPNHASAASSGASSGGSSTHQQTSDPHPAPQSAPSRTIQSENAQNEPMCHPDTPIAQATTAAKQSAISLETQT